MTITCKAESGTMHRNNLGTYVIADLFDVVNQVKVGITK